MIVKKYFNVFSIDYRLLLRGFTFGIKKILWVIAKDAFLFILIFILLAIVFGELLFYNYALFSEFKKPDGEADIIKFKKDIYDSVVQEWQNREGVFKGSLEETYQNPFY